jgi:signal transduction histidine kinase/ligand-binding sensor domain-containing protein
MRMAETPIKAALALVALGTLCVLLWCPHGLAQDRSLDVSQYAHKAWTYRDGFLQGSVFAITQTPDGYLWLATRSGVFRFDGVRLVPLPLPPGQQLPSNVISALLTARDGTLWIGTLNGLVSWKNGQMTEHPAFARRTIRALLQDRDGTLWAGGFVGSTGMLCAIRGGSTTCDGDAGSFGSAVTSLYEDPNGTLWVGASTGVWRWRPGTPTRYPAPQPAIGRGNVPQVQGVPLVFTAGRALRDRNGGLWVGTGVHGLVHSHEGKTSTFTQADGLSGDVVYDLIEDREGTIWVATSDGLDRFRELPVTPLSVKQGLSSPSANSVLAARDGSIWIGTTDGLNRWKDGRTTIYRRRSNPGMPSDDINSLFEDERGRIWVSSSSGLAAFEKGKFTVAPSVPAAMNNAMVGDSHGGLWLSLWGGPKDGLAHLVDGKIIEQVSWQKLGGGPGTGLVADPEVGVWTGLLSGGIAYFRAGEIRNLPLSDDAAGVRRVLEVSRDRDGSIWAATENGLSRIKNGQVRTLTTANGLPCKTVHWIIEDDVSSYWMYTECGVLRVARTDIEAWTADSTRTIRPTTFDAVDGVRLVPILKGFRPAVTKSSDGKIWFLNGGETVSFIDPSRISINALPPPTHIEQITADGKTYDATSGLRLPPHVRNLAINYTALSMGAPERLHFRFKLEGQDSEWREVVNDRRVQYSNLRPGNYTFRVIASNNSGVWNEQGDVLAFSVAPAYYQTKWFRALCAVTFLGLLWVAYHLRIRKVAYQFNMRLEERVSERTRIARDLHDTLLQSFQALLPLLQAAIYKLPGSPVDARKTLETAVDQAAEAITEGRDALQGLRMSTVERNDLALGIRTVGEELASAETNGSSPKFEVVVEGTSRNLHPILRDEIYRVATEAMRNAFRHAAARNVEVEIRYDEKNFRLRVRDDGNGIRDEVLRAAGREGHYGLHGMRERAELVGGKLTIWSEVGSGTEIELIIPGSRAYAKSRRRFLYFGKRSATNTEVKETIERE